MPRPLGRSKSLRNSRSSQLRPLFVVPFALLMFAVGTAGNANAVPTSADPSTSPISAPTTPALDLSPAPRISFDVPTRVLSTQHVIGTLTIDNVTNTELGYDPISVSFLIRQSDGSTREQLWITTISHLIPTTWIAPGSQQSFSITMPTCEVLGDSCTQRVALRFALTTRVGAWERFVTEERIYTEVPDRSATFEVDGLSGNRPLLLAPGESAAEVQRTTAEFRFALTGEDRGLDESVEALCKRNGLSMTSAGEADGDRIITATRADRTDTPPDDSQLAAVSDGLRRLLGTRMGKLAVSFVPTGIDQNPVFGEASRAAVEKATHVALFLGVDPLRATWVGGTLVRLSTTTTGSNDGLTSPFVTWNQFVFDPTVKRGEGADAPRPLTIQARTTTAQIGARQAPDISPAFGAGASGLEYAASNSIDALEARLTIAADRTEVFAVAETTAQGSARRGLDADAVATTLAKRRATVLAGILGLRAGPLTLVAKYPEQDWTEGARLVPVGVAVASVGDSSSGWRRLDRQQMATPHPARTTSAPSPMLVQTTAVPQQSPTPGPPESLYPSPVTDVEPIDVAGAPTALTTTASRTVSEPADEYWVNMVAGFSGDPSGYGSPDGVPDVASVVARLAAIVPASTIVVTGSSNGSPLPVGFGVTVRGTKLDAVERVARVLRSMYPREATRWQYDVKPGLRDCSKGITDGLRASAALAVEQATTSAARSNRTLRYLVLGAAYLPNTGDACENISRSFELYTVTGTSLRRPSSMSVPISVPVKLVFRTIS